MTTTILNGAAMGSWVADGVPISLGVGFTSSASGYIAAIRYYVGGRDMDGKTVSAGIYSITGSGPSNLGSLTITSAMNGWVDIPLSSPYAITAGTAYYGVVWLPTPGYFGSTTSLYASAVTNGVLTAFANGTSGHDNGAYDESNSSGGIYFPTQGAGNGYGVDVVYSSTSATAPGAPTGVTAVAGNGSAVITFTAPASDGGSSITGYTATSTPGSITGTISGASAAPITVSGLANGTSYTFTVHATNAIGNSAESAASNSVTPQSVLVPTQLLRPTGLVVGRSSLW